MNKTEFQNIIKSVREQLATDGIATISTGNCNYPKPIMTKKQEEQKRAMITADFEKENNLDGYGCWMNPPFSKATAMFEHFFKVVIHGVAIYRCDNMETQLWALILNEADWVHIFNKRINYEGHKGKGARFGSALFGVGVPPPKNLEGTTIHKIN